MSNFLLKSYSLIKYIVQNPDKKKLIWLVIEKADKDLINAFSEITYNLVFGNISLNEDQKNIFKRNKKLFQTLASKTISTKRRKSIIKKLLLKWTKFVLPSLREIENILIE